MLVKKKLIVLCIAGTFWVGTLAPSWDTHVGEGKKFALGVGARLKDSLEREKER